MKDFGLSLSIEVKPFAPIILTLKFKSVSGSFSKTEFPTFSFSAVSPIAPLGPFMIKGYREESFHIMVTFIVKLT